MKLRSYTMLFATLFCFATATHAKMFRVGYTGPQVTGTDYATFQEAHDEADDGDTLVFYPGNSYTGTADRRLVYLGYGYFLRGTGANEGLQLITGGTTYLTITLNSGSGGSHFEGLGDVGGYLLLNVNDAINDIVIRRCHYPSIYSTTALDCSNWQIIQSYNAYIHPRANGGTGRFINLRVENSHIQLLYFSGLLAGSSGQISNCVLQATVDLVGASIYLSNNIVQSSSLSNLSGSIFENNICDFAEGANGVITGSGNQFSVTMTDVFLGPTGNSTDGQWQLKPGSPAIGAGIGGIDCGMFAGTNPYRLSGIPSIPVFYKLTAPSRTATTNPYTITFSVKSNN